MESLSREKSRFNIYTTENRLALPLFFENMGYQYEKVNDSSLKDCFIIRGKSVITINHLDRSCPKIYEQLDGFPYYVRHLLQAAPPDDRTFDLLEKIEAVNHIITIIADPEHNEGKKLAESLLTEVNGFLLYNGLILDKSFRMYLGPNGKYDENSQL